MCWVCRHDPHGSLSCFLPPHITDELAKSGDPDALETLKASADARARREIALMMPKMSATPSPNASKYRLIYDMQGRQFPLPGKLVLDEGGNVGTDEAVKEAYEFSGITYDFFLKVFGRNSLDDNGMQLISSVHFGHRIQNAFWNGFQMAYGDGDNKNFLRFTKSLDVVAHELTHGVVSFTSNLVYEDEPGALNESFADIMSAMVIQWHKDQTVEEADWLIGNELVGPALKGKVRAFRVFGPEKAYENVPGLGTDPQPKHITDKYTGKSDNGGVHINSGIPNHAFYRTALAMKGKSWEKAGHIWYETLRALHSTSNFNECAAMTYQIAGAKYGSGSLEQQAVLEGWQAVGLLDSMS